MSISPFRFHLSLTLLLLLAVTQATAQITWRRAYGGFGTEDANSVRQTFDGGYVVLGSSGSLGNGAGDIYLLRINEEGERLWSRVYGGPGVERGVACRELEDGFIIAGTTSTGTNGGYDMVLIRTDLAGEPLWEKHYGTTEWDLCNAVDVLPDGFIIGGISYGAGSPIGNAYVVRTDLNGDTMWTRTVGETYRTECLGLLATAGPGFVLVGSVGTEAGDEDAFFTKLDADGEEQWTSTFGGDSTDYFTSVAQATDGGYVACGGSASASPLMQIHFLKIDNDGAFQWEQYFGSGADAAATEIRNDHNGGFVFTGYNKLNLGERDMILTVTYADGWFQWGNNFGNGSPADGFSVDITVDGGYVIAGWVEEVGPGLRSMYVVKTGPLGQTDVLSVISTFDPVSVPTMEEPDPVNVWPTLLHSGDPLHISGASIGMNSTAFITDTYGRSVAALPLGVSETTLPTSALNPGVYFLSVGSEQGRTFRSRFVVAD